MTRAEAVTAIRAQTDQDGTTQVTDAQMNAWIEEEHRALRRELGQIAPSLYTAADSSQTANTTTGALALPSDYERLVRVERQVGAAWYPVDISDTLTPHIGNLTVREEGAALLLAPVTSTLGQTFRIVYVQKAAATADGAALAVPEGCESVICDRVAARVQDRFQRDSSPHIARANATWTTQKKYLRRRYGAGSVPGLRMTRRW